MTEIDVKKLVIDAIQNKKPALLKELFETIPTIDIAEIMDEIEDVAQFEDHALFGQSRGGQATGQKLRTGARLQCNGKLFIQHIACHAVLFDGDAIRVFSVELFNVAGQALIVRPGDVVPVIDHGMAQIIASKRLIAFFRAGACSYGKNHDQRE